MRIAINAANLRGAGSSLVGQLALQSLAAAQGGHWIEAWVPAQWGWSSGQLGETTLLHSVPGGVGAKVLSDNLWLRYGLWKNNPDCVFSLGDTSLPHAGVPHMLMVQTPYLAWATGELGFRLPRAFAVRVALLRRYFAACLPTTEAITVQTRTMKRRMCRAWGLPSSRVHVVPTPWSLQPEPEKPMPPECNSTPALPRPYLCYPATLSPHKNHQVLVPMIALLRRKGLDIDLVLTVGARESKDLVDLVSGYGMASHVHLLGHQPRSACQAIMARSLAMVMPSRLETLGLPYYEAMAMGVPVIAARRDFAIEACGNAALYASPDSPEEFASHVATVYASSETRAQLSARGLDRVRSMQCDWRSTAAKYIALLGGIAGGAARP